MDPKKRQFAGVLLAVVLTGAGAFVGGHALGAAEKKSHFDADADEVTRTQTYAQGTLSTAVDTLKTLAKDAALNNNEDANGKREKAIGETMKPVQEDLYLLMLQAHLLSVDSMVDQNPDVEKLLLQPKVYQQLGVDPGQVAARRETTGLGHGGLILGYMIAKKSGKPADEIFKLKTGKSWADVVHATNVSVGELGMLLKQ